jgi:hypothetical protein
VSLGSVAFSLTKLVPSTPLARAQTAVYRGLEAIYNQVDWAFQKGFAGWLAPGIVFNQGTFTTTQYSQYVQGDGSASTLIANYTGQPFITQLQYRNPAFAIYDIIGLTWSGTVAQVNILTTGSGQTNGTYTVNILDSGSGINGTAQVIVQSGQAVAVTVLTVGSGYSNPYITFSHGGTAATFQVVQQAILQLDRPWMEQPQGSGQPYIIYQAYFVAPVQDFRKWIAIQDFTNDQPMDFWSLTRADLAAIDPQRQDQSLSTNVVPAGIDLRAGSSTYGWQRFELYPWQGNVTPYTLTFRRLGQLPQSQSDWQTMYPEAPITENMVEFKAKEILLLDKAAEMEAKVPGSGKGMMLLAEMAQKKYYEYFGQVLSVDLNLDGENFTHVHQPGKWQANQPYATMGPNKALNLGGYPGGSGV